jgi:hypothetical protein
MRRINQIFLILLAASSLRGASLPSTKPEDVGLSGERLLRIHSLVQRHMDSGDITGAVVPGRLQRSGCFCGSAGHHGCRDQDTDEA